MGLDGLRAEEERRGDLSVRRALRRKERDLQLLRRERVQAGRTRRGCGPAGRDELLLAGWRLSDGHCGLEGADLVVEILL